MHMMLLLRFIKCKANIEIRNGSYIIKKYFLGNNRPSTNAFVLSYVNWKLGQLKTEILLEKSFYKSALNSVYVHQ